MKLHAKPVIIVFAKESIRNEAPPYISEAYDYYCIPGAIVPQEGASPMILAEGFGQQLLQSQQIRYISDLQYLYKNHAIDHTAQIYK